MAKGSETLLGPSAGQCNAAAEKVSLVFAHKGKNKGKGSKSERGNCEKH